VSDETDEALRSEQEQECVAVSTQCADDKRAEFAAAADARRMEALGKEAERRGFRAPTCATRALGAEFRKVANWKIGNRTRGRADAVLQPDRGLEDGGWDGSVAREARSALRNEDCVRTVHGVPIGSQ
jgi:hypothetical protein